MRQHLFLHDCMILCVTVCSLCFRYPIHVCGRQHNDFAFVTLSFLCLLHFIEFPIIHFTFLYCFVTASSGILVALLYNNYPIYVLIRTYPYIDKKKTNPDSFT